MKLSEFKDEVLFRLGLFRATNRFALANEMAYAGNNWAAVLSTAFYTLSMLLFVNIMYANTKQIAGYTHNDMLFYFLIGQLTYYLNWYTSLTGIYDLIKDVNKGDLDLILMKPVPVLFFLSTRKMGGFSLLIDTFAPITAVIVSIDWSLIHIHPVDFIYGLCIFLFGLISLHVFQFISALPVFWLGESEAIVDLAGFIGGGAGTVIPFEGYSRTLQLVFGTVVPILITTAFTVSAMLNKSNSFMLFLWASAMAFVALWVRKLAWNFAIKNYTSASS